MQDHSRVPNQAQVYQIFYSDQTRAVLDPGFIPLDNTSNERPDWYEYWPIRKYLLSHSLVEDCFYGFLSPKFNEKTGVLADEVFDAISKAPAECTFINLSRYLDQSALYLNVFEQGDMCHPGIADICTELFYSLGKVIDPRTIVNTTSSCVFSNFFVAKPAFWRNWFAFAEQVFEIAENPNDPLGAELSSETEYWVSGVQLKVFVIERLASYLLATEPNGLTSTLNPYLLSRVAESNVGMGLQMSILDALKHAFVRTSLNEYVHAFHQLRVDFGFFVLKQVSWEQNLDGC
jgi:uncharacterized protein YozE (UPF0346 family)